MTTIWTLIINAVMKVVTMIILLVCAYSSFVPHRGKGGLVEWVETIC